MITVTEKAVRQFKEILEHEEKENFAIRLYVSGVG
jgi:Fe-S cluster assembly iron-binding protein IscA